LRKLSDENFILNIVKYTPSIFVVVIALLINFYISIDHTKNLKKDKEEIRKNYIKLNKNIIKTNINNVHKYINNKKLKSINSLKKEIKGQAYNAHNVMTTIYNDFKNMKSKEEIIQIIKSSLKNIRFNEGRSYFFIYDLNGTNIFHPVKPEREGKNFFNIQDLHKKFIIQESINIAKSKKAEGFQTWMFNKPNDTLKEYQKIGFIKKFNPYNWFIGIGEYKQNFQNKVKKEVLDNIKTIEYKDKNNVFVIDEKGNLLLSELNFSNINHLGKNNQFLKSYTNFINSKKESTYLEYTFENEEKRYNKISYLEKINDYNWVIGTGFDYNNLNSMIIQKQKELEEDYQKNLMIIRISTLIITLIFLIPSLFVSRFLKRIFLSYKQKLLENETTKFETMMEELNLIFDNLPINVIYKDTKDNIIRVNKNMADSLNLSTEDLRNKPSKNIFPDFYKEYYKYDLETIKSKKTITDILGKYKSKDGIKLINFSNIPIFDKNGEVRNIIVFITDITEKEALKEDNKRKEILLYQQSKMAIMGEMIANIAHQWKQPLSTITTSATGAKLQKQMNYLSDENLYASLDLINNSAQYLAQTIDDFRNFFNPNKNNYSEFIISSTIEKTLKLLLPKYKTQNIEIIKDIEDVEIISLENEIIQVLINILNNARDELIKYKQRRLIFIKTYKKENSLILEIKDNAKGINKDIIDKIFDPYFTTKKDSEGTGIGLYMSKNILTKLLNAKFKVENKTFSYDNIKYTGVKFSINIPITPS